MGPSFIKADFTSSEVIMKTLNGDFPGTVRIQMGLVDVRDCAKAHLEAATRPEAANKRFFLCEDHPMWFKEIAEVLKEEFGQDYKFKTGELKYCLVKMASLWDPTVKMILPMWGKEFKIDNKRSREILGIDYRQKRETIIEMANALISYGYIKDKRSKK
jgi:nucleoside-diphosphate-sugar epimerase